MPDVTTPEAAPATHILRDSARSILRANRWSRFRRVGTWAAVAACAAALTACGGGAAELTSEERYDLHSFAAAAHLTALDGSGYGDLLDGMDRAKAIARDKPDAKIEGDGGDQVTVRQFIADLASTLAPYQPDVADDLDRTIDTLD